MYLYHYTNIKIKDKIKVKYFAENFYTLNDLKTCKIKRSFYYLTSKILEYRFNNCKYLYKIKVNLKSFYDLRQDKKDLIKKYNTIEGLLLYIKKHYKGAIYSIGKGHNIAISFFDLKIT